MTDIGTNLTSYPNLQFVEGNSAAEVLDQLKQIRLPYQIVSMYAVGGRHFAWVSPTQPLKKKTKQGV